MNSWWTRLKQAMCSHVVFIDDIRRVNDELVEAPCMKCGKKLTAPYGLVLPAKLIRRLPIGRK